MSTPIAEQAAERGVEMDTLLGKHPADLRAMGFDIGAHVPENAVLGRENPEGPVDLGELGRRTGFVWISTKMTAVSAPEALSAKVASETDREVFAQMFGESLEGKLEEYQRHGTYTEADLAAVRGVVTESPEAPEPLLANDNHRPLSAPRRPLRRMGAVRIVSAAPVEPPEDDDRPDIPEESR